MGETEGELLMLSFVLGEVERMGGKKRRRSDITIP